ncbi:hypothetical protein [uncultured Ruegeria sp.]|uniref:hypothetical protein n=1 Tax=uncultured Ruegeria sp. TaxID=259304 RepID=UPI002611A953|nr:hypothetical protein [uncultured Ruegeria sp.]
MEIMVLAGSPLDFPSWHPDLKLNRYNRVMKWHDEYLPSLYQDKKVTHSWGSHEILSRFDPTTSLGILSCVYDVESLEEFDTLMAKNPLRDISRFTTLPLCSLFEDQRSDYERTERSLRHLMTDKNAVQEREIENRRALYSGPPEFVGETTLTDNPPNTPNELSEASFPNDELRILLVACNPNNLIESWDDLRKQVLYEKVNWWFDYMALMIKDRRVSHGWGTHDFCNIEGMSVNSKGAVHVLTAKDFEDFHIFYNLDPLREWARFHTVLLNPIGKQRKLDKLRLDSAQDFLK